MPKLVEAEPPSTPKTEKSVNENVCKACEGTGKASNGTYCYPCNGTGKQK